MDMDMARDFFKKYSPLTICFIGAMLLLTVGARDRASLLLVAGFVMQLFWSWRRHRRG
ncbi:hypothetical protein MUO71_07835 [Candidatus Bathyarchaeota archaeon]|nr:hypothetical protein [Candidatus Bathyarchaeota archaeon]